MATGNDQISDDFLHVSMHLLLIVKDTWSRSLKARTRALFAWLDHWLPHHSCDMIETENQNPLAKKGMFDICLARLMSTACRILLSDPNEARENGTHEQAFFAALYQVERRIHFDKDDDYEPFMAVVRPFLDFGSAWYSPNFTVDSYILVDVPDFWKKLKDLWTSEYIIDKFMRLGSECRAVHWFCQAVSRLNWDCLPHLRIISFSLAKLVTLLLLVRLLLRFFFEVDLL